MATYEVFVPVQGEVIYRIEADNAVDAENIVSTMDWSDGEANLATDADDDTRVELIAGAEGDLDDDDDDDDEMSSAAIRDARDVERNWEDTEFLPVTLHAETGKPYAMRHYRL